MGAVLGNMVVNQAQMVDQPSQRLLKHIIRCYLRLSDNPRWVPRRCRAVLPGQADSNLHCAWDGRGAHARSYTWFGGHPCHSYPTFSRLLQCPHPPPCALLLPLSAREALRSCLPELLRNSQFTACLKNDETTRRWAWSTSVGEEYNWWWDLPQEVSTALDGVAQRRLLLAVTVAITDPNGVRPESQRAIRTNNAV